jgi:hypothetical protein
MIHKVINVKANADFSLLCTYEHGEIVEYDMSGIRTSTGAMAQPLKDEKFFAKVFLESGAPTWPNGYDLCPEAIYREGKHLTKPKAAGG